MSFWRTIILALLAVLSLAGCVYGPPYYEDPYSPSPWIYPEPYPPDYFGHHPRDPDLHRHRHGDPDYPDRGIDAGPPDYRPSPDGNVQGTPPPNVLPPAPEKSAEPKPDTKDIPMASKGSKPGRVKVPFAPYNELDVSGLQSGSLAKDPVSGKVFRIP